MTTRTLAAAGLRATRPAPKAEQMSVAFLSRSLKQAQMLAVFAVIMSAVAGSALLFPW